MHPAERVGEVVSLAATGLSATAIAERTMLPRETVRDWLDGKLPRSFAVPTCLRCGGSHASPDDAPAPYTYLLGLYLGDGCISRHPRGVYRLRTVLDAKYPGIVRECAAAVSAVLPASKVLVQRRSDNCFEVSSYSKAWPCLFPQHGRGKKHERPIVLADWQRRHVAREPGLLLRGLIQSDGCRFVNTGRGGWRHPRYSFCNLSADIRQIFCDACDLLGLRWTLSPPKTVYVSRKDDVAVLDELVGPKR